MSTSAVMPFRGSSCLITALVHGEEECRYAEWMCGVWMCGVWVEVSVDKSECGYEPYLDEVYGRRTQGIHLPP